MTLEELIESAKVRSEKVTLEDIIYEYRTQNKGGNSTQLAAWIKVKSASAIELAELCRRDESDSFLRAKTNKDMWTTLFALVEQQNRSLVHYQLDNILNVKETK